MHANEVSHNDVHDNNIILDKKNKFWLIDFGLSSFNENKRNRDNCHVENS